MLEEKASATLMQQTITYINDPDTRVYINHNDETGEWLYSVVVDGSGGFWLNSFETRKEADGYIIQHHLKTIED